MKPVYFVLWLALALGGLLLLSACGAQKSRIAYENLPATGDVARGAALYREPSNNAPSCLGCHSLDGTDAASPTLLGYGAVAGERVAGQSAHEYTFWSIVEPGRHIVSGYGNVMYNQYDRRLSAQDIADLIAYLLTL